METLKFKTTINCGGCKSKASNFLNTEKAIVKWDVDTDNPDKILTVEGEGISEQLIAATVAKAGFKATLIQ